MLIPEAMLSEIFDRQSKLLDSSILFENNELEKFGTPHWQHVVTRFGYSQCYIINSGGHAHIIYMEPAMTFVTSDGTLVPLRCFVTQSTRKFGLVWAGIRVEISSLHHN